MATRTAWGRPMNRAVVKKRPATQPAAVTNTPAPVTSPSAIRFGGYWPDGTIKLIQPDGTALPHGSTFSVQSGHTIVAGPDGMPVQVQSGGSGVHAANALTDALSLPGVDPALGYAAGSANRGLGYQNQDYNTNWQGFTVGADGQVARPGDLGSTNPDGSPKYGRSLTDYFTALDRTNQAYANNTSDLHTQYKNLADSQLESAAQNGLLEGGALAQALSKRTANEGLTQGRLDTAHNQSLSDLLTQTSRGATDAYTGLQRAVGENAPYQATLQQQAAMEAGPSLVGNPNYEVLGNTIYTRLPDGSVKAVKKKPATTTTKPPPVRTAFGRPMNYAGG